MADFNIFSRGFFLEDYIYFVRPPQGGGGIRRGILLCFIEFVCTAFFLTSLWKYFMGKRGQIFSTYFLMYFKHIYGLFWQLYSQKVAPPSDLKGGGAWRPFNPPPGQLAGSGVKLGKHGFDMTTAMTSNFSYFWQSTASNLPCRCEYRGGGVGTPPS